MAVNLRAGSSCPGASRRMLDQGLIVGSELPRQVIQTASIASYRGGNQSDDAAVLGLEGRPW